MFSILRAYNADLDTIIECIMNGKIGELHSFLKTHPFFNLTACSFNYSATPLYYAAVDYRAPDYVALLLQYGAQFCAPMSNASLSAASTCLDYAVLTGDCLLLPLFFFHEKEELPDENYFQVLRGKIKIRDVELREKAYDLLDNLLPQAYGYRDTLKNAADFEQAKQELNAVIEYQKVINLLMIQRENSQTVSYTTKKYPLDREVLFAYYTLKLIDHAKKNLQCLKNLSSSVPFEQMEEWFDSISEYPTWALRINASKQWKTLLLLCIKLLQQWGKEVKDIHLEFALKCFSQVGGWYRELSERTLNKEESFSYLQQAAQYFAYRDTLTGAPRQSDVTKEAYRALISQATENNLFEQAKMYQTLMNS